MKKANPFFFIFHFFFYFNTTVYVYKHHAHWSGFSGKQVISYIEYVHTVNVYYPYVASNGMKRIYNICILIQTIGFHTIPC